MKDGGGHTPFQKLRFTILSLPLCESASLSVAVEELTPLLDTSGDREEVGGSVNVFEDSSGVSMVMFCFVDEKPEEFYIVSALSPRCQLQMVLIMAQQLTQHTLILYYLVGLCQNTSCSVL